ncbi:MAG TPA: OmpA family protein [Tepidisphaeraceae bacterium]|nr:OmpA family protein [Tepidisphaeraceae bacterium]
MAKTACKKCDPHEICEECPEWIFTLADLIMCMMGLFVILWVLKPGPKDNLKNAMTDEEKNVVAAIREAFGYVPQANSNDPIDMHMLMKKIDRMKSPGDGGKTQLEQKAPDGTDPEVTSIRQGRQATVGGKLLFDPAQAELSRETTAQLEKIVQIIRGHRQIVLVKGHTSLDDLPDGTSAQQKMDLAVRRAKAVADYLTAKGVEPDILRVQGCSTFEPVIQRRYGPGAQANNRRVEVEVTATLVEELQDRSAVRQLTTDPPSIVPPQSVLGDAAQPAAAVQ